MNRPETAFVEELDASGRFTLRRKLGAGAYGVVYEAWDAERQLPVALKRLHHLQPTAIYRFKREFRSLADVVHPNLVQLYELLSDGKHWFFTMELVPGVPLLEWVRPERRFADEALRSEAMTMVSGHALETAATLVLPPREAVQPLDLGRLRAAFIQLVEGVRALHAAGKLHRDLKSQNVLVTRDGRVVLLDFGLVHELGPRSEFDAFDPDIVGTPLYMAPEQATGAPLRESADWYAVGVTLYHALTGTFPFEGRAVEVLFGKQTRDPLPPAVRVSDVPRDLDLLCMDLLKRRPEDRPDGAEILARLGQLGSTSQVTTRAVGERPFVGRVTELARLHAAADRMLDGRGQTVLVHGPSGMGKSALVRHFLGELERARPDVLVLEGRCYATESLPYKAIDGVVDSLGRFLAAQDAEQVAKLLPPHVGELAQLFSTLRRVPEIDVLAGNVVQLPDPIERRRRALGALRELLAAIARSRPLVVFVDDLQWGDVDSALAVAQLVQAPEPPPFLLLGTYRSEEAETSPFLRAFASLEGGLDRGARDDLAIGALSGDDARLLVSTLLAHDSGVVDPRAAQIAAEAAGSPLFIDQLATAHKERQSRLANDDGAAGSEPPSLADVIEGRLEQLPPEARRLLEVLAVAGQPVEDGVLRVASGFNALESSGLGLLRSARLVRTRTTDGRAQSEVYHDRIRETVSGSLSRAVANRTHRSLAEAFELTGETDVDLLATHWRAAGEQKRAFEYTLRAADRAYGQLAFDRAARLYREALDERPSDVQVDGALEVRLGDALRDAGRGAEAAAAYATASRVTRDPDVALDLRRQAGEQLLASGHHDAARRELGAVLEAVGMSLPQTPAMALAAFVLRRAQLQLRGLEFEPKPAETVSVRDRFKMDVCWTIATGLAMIDPVRAGAFQSVHMLLALQSGDVARVARAFAVEVPFSATPGPSNRARTVMLTRRARTLAAQVADPHVFGLLTSSVGGAAWLEGRWSDALELSERADTILRMQCTGVAWQIDTTSIVLFDCLYRLGRWREVIDRVPALLADARVRGDLYMEIYVLVKFGTLARMAAGEPSEASAELTRAIGRWSQERFSLLHYWELYGQCEAALYRRRPVEAARRVRDGADGVKSSLLLQLQLYRVSWADIRGRAALADAASRGRSQRVQALAPVRACVRELEREDVAWSKALGSLIEGGLLATRGEPAEASAVLREAERALTAVGMSLHAASARARRAELAGETRELEAAHADIAAQGVADPARVVEVLAPGAFER